MRCLRQAFAARAAEHPESAEPPAAPADTAAALAEAVARAAAAEETIRNADAEASQRQHAERERAAALLASDAALQDARAAITTLERERAQLMQRLLAAEQRAAELQHRLHAAEAAARAEVPAQILRQAQSQGGLNLKLGGLVRQQQRRLLRRELAADQARTSRGSARLSLPGVRVQMRWSRFLRWTLMALRSQRHCRGRTRCQSRILRQA